MVATTLITNNFSLEDFMANPPDRMEWVDGQLVEKNGVTLKHGEIQLRLGSYWLDHINSSRQGGKVYTSVPYRTNKQGRSPDVAYLTPELVAQFVMLLLCPRVFLCVPRLFRLQILLRMCC
ncbi:MAG TPA: Uma2 family endonuclease [Coleofasciculaceae cyanobacterium]